MTASACRLPRLASLVVVAFVLTCAVLLTHDARAQGPIVIADGHIDIGPVMVDGGWRLQLRDDTGAEPVWRDFADIVLHAVDASRTTVPEGEPYRFLGEAGADVWLLPQAQRPGILWPGWNTQHPSIATEVERQVTWTLQGVDGPGDFVLFLTGSFGDSTVLFSTREALPQSFAIAMGTHVHGNWAFTAPGTYRLTMAMSGARASGETLSDTRVLTITVGDGEPAATATPADTATATPAASTATPIAATSTPDAATSTPPAANGTPASGTNTPAVETPATSSPTSTPDNSPTSQAAPSATPPANTPAGAADDTTPDSDDERSSSTLLVVAIAAAGVAVLALGGGVAWLARRSRRETP